MNVAGHVVRAGAVFACASIAALVVGAQFSSWQQPGVLAPIRLEPSTISAPTETFGERRFDVSIQRRDGSTARGWLLLPVGTTMEVAVVIVAGAGPSTRDDLLPLASALSRSGVAALVYDKRSDGYTFRHRDFDTLAEDAADAGHFLAEHWATHDARLAVLGISEGGWIVPRAAVAAPHLFSAVLLVSAPVVTPLAKRRGSWIERSL